MEANQSAYEIEPELQGKTPRPVRERSYIVALQLWLTRAAAVALCFVCYLASHSLREANAWLHGQQKTIGIVLAKSIYSGGKSNCHQIVFSYDALPGSRNEGSACIDEGSYNSLREDGPLAVYYCKGNPGGWQLSPVKSSDISNLQTEWYLGIAFGAAVMTSGLYSLKCYRESRLRLLRDGYAAIATVTKHEIVTGGKGEQFRYLHYRWVDYKGAEHAQQQQVSETNYAKYADDTQFTVISPADDRFSSVPYFLITEAVVEG